MFAIVLLIHCGFTRASVKTASMSKQRWLPPYWFVLVGTEKGQLIPVTGIVIVGVFTFGALTRLALQTAYWLLCFCGIVCLRVHTFDGSCRSVPFCKAVTQLTLHKGRSGSHSIIYMNIKQFTFHYLSHYLPVMVWCAPKDSGVEACFLV
jgi:hypothetical protein